MHDNNQPINSSPSHKEENDEPIKKEKMKSINSIFKNKKILIGTAIALVILAAAGIFFFISTANASIGNIQVFEGKAQLISNNNSKDARTGNEVHLNDRLKISPESTVAIVLKDNSVIRLEAGSEVEVSEITYEGEKLKNAKFRLITGRLWSRTTKLSGGSTFEVETPTVTASVRGTSFNTTYNNSITGIFVSTHSVKVTYNGKSQTVEEEELLRMNNNNLEGDFDDGAEKVEPDFYEDEWITFNEQQDYLLCKKLRDLPECEITKSPTPTPTPKPSATPTRFPTRKPTPTPTPTPKPTDKPNPTATNTPPTNTPAPTSTPTPTTIPPTPTPTDYILY